MDYNESSNPIGESEWPVLKLNIVKESDFVKLDLKGKFDYDQTLKAMRNMLSKLGEDSTDDFLFDLMETKCNLNELDIYQIAEFMEDHVGLFKGRIALLLGESYIIDKSRFLKYCINDPTIRMRIFFDKEAAEQWLTSPPTLT